MTGGPAITVARIQGLLLGASWGPDDTIVFATDDAGHRTAQRAGRRRGADGADDARCRAR